MPTKATYPPHLTPEQCGKLKAYRENWIGRTVYVSRKGDPVAGIVSAATMGKDGRIEVSVDTLGGTYTRPAGKVSLSSEDSA